MDGGFDIRPAAVALAKQAPQADELRKAAERFETLFAKMMLKAMRDTVPESEFAGHGGEMYQEMLDGEYAKLLTRDGGLGIADALVRQLGSHAQPQPPGPQRSQATALTPGSFIGALLPAVRARAEKHRVPLEGVLAQAALETGWGRHVPQLPDGRSSNNVFGIKADAGWKGERVAHDTLEFIDGAMVRRREWFRAYPSIDAAVEDYFRFLGKPRYDAVRGSGTVDEFARGLQEAGYATDPEYANKLRGVAEGRVLRTALNHSGKPPITV